MQQQQSRANYQTSAVQLGRALMPADYEPVLKSRALITVVLVVFAVVLAAGTLLGVVAKDGDTAVMGDAFGSLPVEELVAGPASLAAVAGLAAIALLDMGVTREGETSALGSVNTFLIAALLVLLAFWAAWTAPTPAAVSTGTGVQPPTLAMAAVAGMVVAAAAGVLGATTETHKAMGGSFVYGVLVFAAAMMVLSYGLGYYFELVFTVIEGDGAEQLVMFALSCAAIVAVLWGLGRVVHRLHLFARGPDAKAASPAAQDAIATVVSAVVVTTAAIMWRFRRTGGRGADETGWLTVGAALMAVPLIAVIADRASANWGPGAEVVKYVAILAATAYVGLGFVPWSIGMFGLLSAGVVASYAMGLSSQYARVAFYALVATYAMQPVLGDGTLTTVALLVGPAVLFAFMGDGDTTTDTFAGFAVFYALLYLLGYTADGNDTLSTPMASATDFFLLFVSMGAVTAAWHTLDFTQALGLYDGGKVPDMPPVVRLMTMAGTGGISALLFLNLRTDPDIRTFVEEKDPAEN